MGKFNREQYMYKKRLLIFISICLTAIGICLLRIFYMALHAKEARIRIAEMQILPPEQLPTLRGSIYDRNGKVLASDKPVFNVQVGYELTKVLDERYIEGVILLEMAKRKKDEKDQELTRERVETEIRKELEDEYHDLASIIKACAKLKQCSREEIEVQIRSINDDIWQMRRFFAWRNNNPKSPLLLEYKKLGKPVPSSKAMEDYKVCTPDRDERTREMMVVDLLEMKQSHSLIELNDEEKFAAQMAFMDIPGVEIVPETKRVYKYGPSACQIIGWVGMARSENDTQFSDDKFSRYISGEVAGKSGIEAMCEPVLRGQRGEIVYNRDGERIEMDDAEFGKDISLAIDIELQRRLEDYLIDPNQNTNYNAAMGAVIIDVESSDILALVSLPTYNLNTIRSRYNDVKIAANNPFENKAIYKTYPPGSSIKPVMLAIGIDERVVTANDIISCPCQKAPPGWPSCWIHRQSYTCHDAQWEGGTGNNGRNAIRGSCNIYFSRVANMANARAIQKWLYNFGYGRSIMAAPNFLSKLKGLDRETVSIKALQESAGQISSAIPKGKIKNFDDITRLNDNERRWFGIGQGSLRVTVLQVANAMASIARGGVFRKPKLFIDEDGKDNYEETVGIRPETVLLIREGMHAVVYEQHGTAYTHFRDHSDLDQRDITVYGKTGSTQTPANAWFAGFAEDSAERCIAIAIVIEGGTSGSGDAAPLGRRMIEMCNELGYVGKNIAGEYAEVNSAQDR